MTEVSYRRLLAATISFKNAGLKQIFLRLFLVPLYFLLLWAFYRDMKVSYYSYYCFCATVFLSKVYLLISLVFFRMNNILSSVKVA